jgi:hypothetical protein
MQRIPDRAAGRGGIGAAILSTRIASLPADLIRHDLITTQAPVPEAALTEIVDSIFLPSPAGTDPRPLTTHRHS